MVWKENISIRRLILLRLPTDLKDRIQELAEFNNRSANQEVVAAIEYWILRNSHVEVLTISDAAERIFQLEREMEVVKEKLGI
ncbi:Arc family DNA-binding protein [Providencia rustigianii]|uniref:Arc family DNA-binding protein n=1 Tax=Providencia rustigianii TaxID=158850 RepID=UPI002AD26342|nr:Arc family DNA-binding protein [Providencia rustigianii]